ncbi:methionyl-tRNA formyltransferase [Muriicola marianensis]|uniref:Methionyl-tRNA formyltransferase n=2 Tax=Muriicola marianensis TaxID=1324801 RepID=A0ABQ1QQ91_9FLAO|nr:methionyl-tRNA formyltransferase [Muriicola marianensis]
MGTPDFAVATLDALIKNNIEVAGVITAPDRPAGRGQALRQSAVKRYAMEHGLKVLQPTNLKNEDFLKELRDLKANLQIVVAFRMLPRVVWDMPEYGTFNLHASLLPDYRGAAPINWAIINGETRTGVTTFFIDEKIDTGGIIMQEECAITREDTAGMLHDRLMVLGAELVLKTVDLIEREEVKVMPQKELETEKSAPKLTRENCEINWNLPGGEIYDHIRGLSPYPTAWTTLHNGEEAIYLKVFGASYIPERHTSSPGQIVPHHKLRVAVDGGWIDLEEIQLPGKRKMASREVLNGLKLESNAHVR